MSMKTKALFTL